jgi:predicted DNA binding protein
VTNHDHDHEAFVERVQADERVERLRVVDELPEKTLYRIEWTHGIDDVLDLFIEHDIWVEQANTLSSEERVDERAPAAADIGTGTDVWRFQLRAPTRDALAALYAACRERGMEPRIQQIVTAPTSIEGDQWGITDKQRDALLAAYSEGYFGVPRATSLSELADDFGISRQAYSRRLMRGMYSMLSHTLVIEDEFHENESENRNE